MTFGTPRDRAVESVRTAFRETGMPEDPSLARSIVAVDALLDSPDILRELAGQAGVTALLARLDDQEVAAKATGSAAVIRTDEVRALLAETSEVTR